MDRAEQSGGEAAFGGRFAPGAPEPATPGPGMFEVVLPVGYRDQAGTLHRSALLRKMRGYEEELLHDTTLSLAGLVTALIQGCLVRLGSIEYPDADVVADMYSADRAYLLLEIRRITLGDRMRARYICTHCGSEVAADTDLGSLQVTRWDDAARAEAIALELEDGYRDRDGTVHGQVVMRLPTGRDEQLVSRTAEQHPLRARDALVLRCLRRLGEVPEQALESYGLKILRDLTLGDRMKLYGAIDANAPGIRFREEVKCNGCGSLFIALMDAADFFVPG